MARVEPSAEQPAPPDGTLVARAQAGDRQAVDALVRRWQRPVYGLAVRLLGPGEEARDAAQEALVKAMLAISDVDPERPFGPWLMTVARNHYRDRLRRRRVRRAVLADDPDGDRVVRLPDRQPGAEERVAASERSRALDAALAELPDHYREVVVLHHLESLPVARIARELGRPPGTIMTWLFRARAALRQALSDRGIE